MVVDISVSDMLKKLNLEKEVEQQRKLLQATSICIGCGTPMTPEGGCWICYGCGESSC